MKRKIIIGVGLIITLLLNSILGTGEKKPQILVAKVTLENPLYIAEGGGSEVVNQWDYVWFGNPSPTETALVPKISSLNLKETKECYVKLCWSKVDEAQMYYIYRSEENDNNYNFLRGVNLNDSSYTDKTVVPGKEYYYKVIPWGEWKNEDALAIAISKKIKVYYLPQPLIQVKKSKTSLGQKYVQISLKQYQGDYVEIYYKEKTEGKYHKLSIKKRKISKYKQRFKLRYEKGGLTLRFKVRTYVVKKGKKQYSRYSKIIKKRI